MHPANDRISSAGNSTPSKKIYRTKPHQPHPTKRPQVHEEDFSIFQFNLIPTEPTARQELMPINYLSPYSRSMNVRRSSRTIPSPRTPTPELPTPEPVPSCIPYKGKNYTRAIKTSPSTFISNLREACIDKERLEYKGYILTKKGKIRPTPDHPRARVAVALHVEMVEMYEDLKFSKAFEVFAIDMLTGEVLLSKVVLPRGAATLGWWSRFNGMAAKRMVTELIDQRMVKGVSKVREMLWEFIGEKTVLVGHDLWFGLRALAMAHERVVDTAIWGEIEAEKERSDLMYREWTLKGLVGSILEMEIHGDGRELDCLECAYAVRELVLCCVRYPKKFVDWAQSIDQTEFERYNTRERLY